MKHFAYYFGIAAALVASCSIQEEDIKTPQQDDVIFYASFEQPAEEGTRVYANEDLLLRWTADDRVSIFNKITYNQEYKFLGETGDNAGGFNRVDNAEFVTGNPISHVVSVYPYQAATKITEEEVVTLSLPAEQHYANKTFGLGANTMVSVSADNFLQYKNACGYLRLSLYGEGVLVSSITLKGNDGEILAGDALVTMPFDGSPSVVLVNSATDAITLVCDTPVELGTTIDESKDFWFVVPPVTFNKGFKIKVTLVGGRAFEYSTTKSVAIERNNLSKMSPIEVDLGATPYVPVPDAVDLGLSVRWASFNLGATKPEEYGDYYAWGETRPYYISINPLTWKEGKEFGYEWSSYKWCIGGDKGAITKYCVDSRNGYNGFTDGKTILDLEDDAAHVNLGGEWRMPTEAEWIELRENCTRTWISQEGRYGLKMTSKKNGNSIFLPAVGYFANTYLYINSSGTFARGQYWSSSLRTDRSYEAMNVWLESDMFAPSASKGRCQGLSVRPVTE